jgi:predicted heme/steroid binding protein
MTVPGKYYVRLLVLLLTAAVFISACSSAKSPSPEDEDLDNLPEFTLEELAEYDGKDGRKAYVAVDGIVYDVTDSRPWKNGEHNGFTAGRDLTEEIKNVSPHGVSKLRNVPAVGKIKE